MKARKGNCYGGVNMAITRRKREGAVRDKRMARQEENVVKNRGDGDCCVAVKKM